ncbi:hypothetical protein ACS0X5_25210 [Burkholderia gladioli]|uniref:hypothetical protein n=1 Tax=Burkholderia gladioli TaxID=28095 RepID=UPI0003A2AFE0|nr:hypothetical protein [Burkholderia gladioli]MDN7751650.1 hypothetical protein [Burkholderia gladioli]NHH81627.1 hypothetical protein [Burkholderia gladioli]CAG9239686.1 conserved exported hypothetical protein [Burkholderia gladioli]
MRIPVFASLLFALASMSANAATSITIDAKQNCIQNAITPGASFGNSATFQLAPGRYVMSLSPNAMSCGGTACQIDTVHVLGGMANARWGVAVKQTPIIVDVAAGAGAANFYGFITDDNCADNSGQATLLIQTVN